MTPAERLRAAADTIERTAVGCSGSPWSVDPRFQWDVRDDRGRKVATAHNGYEGVARHVATWDPRLALIIGRLARETAETLEMAGVSDWGDVAEGQQWRELADAILGGGK
jgi:hypothetical protein